jgi:DNA-binding transcriptional regulator YhcF (GntR family)
MQLAGETGLSLNTVQRAVLVDEGLVITVPGHGVVREEGVATLRDERGPS